MIELGYSMNFNCEEKTYNPLDDPAMNYKKKNKLFIEDVEAMYPGFEPEIYKVLVVRLRMASVLNELLQNYQTII